ncbi:MAG: dTDP-4-dehydrorhamnose reductase [Geothrix sp.]|uniref:dTDP-4-dehydrorhamnose reductase n=1 Tax=Geothrix sp. TaxID=1962974 RepID=UPI00183A6377|nr:dTDP-4-dehydrorhamnose reductase [Geothrix sp.]NWJ41641.1 dTDP-4-dehydrorhamnose reductase [Geothrix sp.]WIL20376.1 MAG: dTDP-4-dehydrorhamnose reductase [Geothrix sp.]
MRVLVTGGAGQLAQALRKTWLGHELILPEESVLDLSDPDSIRRVVAQVRPDILINCGAFTQVDRCESEPELAVLINATAVGWLAEACEAQRALLVQISTDYVFDGTSRKPYREEDPTNPTSVYGRTKLEGEYQAARCSRHLIARTSWLYDAWGKNFFNTMLAAAAQGRPLRVVDDQWGAPTSCRALARQLLAAAEHGWHGLVHASCAGETTWHEFAKAIFEAKGMAPDLSPCTSDGYPTPARRPAYSVLDGAKRRKLGPDLMPTWMDALREVIDAPELDGRPDV